MRITDDRYTRDRQRLDLAVRMIRHEARTCTIRTWTGLSDDRIRKLYRTYIAVHGNVRRHRGKSPAQTAFFFKNVETRRHAAALAGLFARLELLYGSEAAPGTGGTAAALRWGDLFCRTYETYLQLHHSQRISFEHAWYLLHVLQRQAELRPACCAQCGAFMLIDLLRPAGTVCAACESDNRDHRARA